MTARGPRHGSVPDRDVRVPKELPPAEGAPIQPWHEEPTGVHTDAQVFRAVKALGEELQANKLEAARAHGALKQEVAELGKTVDARLTKQDTVLASQNVTLSRMAGQLDVLVPSYRSRPSSTETKAIVDKALETSGLKFRREIVLKLVGGAVALVTSGAFLGWWLS